MKRYTYLPRLLLYIICTSSTALLSMERELAGQRSNDASLERFDEEAIKPQNPLLEGLNRNIKKRAKCKTLRNCLLNNTGSLAVLALASVTVYFGYTYGQTYYNALYSSCDQMEDACKDCTQEFKTVEAYMKTISQYIEQCPAAMERFMPRVLSFLENCCEKQK